MKVALQIFTAAIVLTSLWSCQRQEPQPQIPLEMLKEGDLAFRTGTSTASKVVLALDRGGEYSHIGVIAKRGGEWLVVHAVPGENEDEGRDTVKAEPAIVFFSYPRAIKGAIFRLANDSIAAKRAAEEALRIAKRGTEFDHKYDWGDTTRLYCAQLVQRCYEKAGVDMAEGRQHTLNVPAFSGNYVFPSDLAANKNLHCVYCY